jgi:hypothetical protein
MHSQWSAAASALSIPGVARLIVLWSRPHHLPAAQADRWAIEQVTEIAKADGVGGAVLTRLDSASPRHRCDWDWLVELEIELPARGWIDDWLGDLRLLGSRPAALLADQRIPLEEG